MSELLVFMVGLPLFFLLYGVTLWYQLKRWPDIRDSHDLVADIDFDGPMHAHIHELMTARRDYLLIGWACTWAVDFIVCSRSHTLWMRLISVGIWAALVVVTARLFAWRLIVDSRCPPHAPVPRSGTKTPTPGGGPD